VEYNHSPPPPNRRKAKKGSKLVSSHLLPSGGNGGNDRPGSSHAEEETSYPMSLAISKSHALYGDPHDNNVSSPPMEPMALPASPLRTSFVAPIAGRPRRAAALKAAQNIHNAGLDSRGRGMYPLSDSRSEPENILQKRTRSSYLLEPPPSKRSRHTESQL
jgi:hypothetical protein